MEDSRTQQKGTTPFEETKLELRLGPPGDESRFPDQRSGRESFLSSVYCFENGTSHNSGEWLKKQQQTAMYTSFLQSPTRIPDQTESLPPRGLPTFADLNMSCPSDSSHLSQKRTASGPVVGWPPVRSFRKNLSGSSSLKPVVSENISKETPAANKRRMFTKVNMDGIPIGRKLDLSAYDNYQKLASAVDVLFKGLLAAQIESAPCGGSGKAHEEMARRGLLDGSGEYTLIYEDDEGDKMLVGDVPWNMFVSTVKRLRVLKSSDLSSLSGGGKMMGIKLMGK